MFSYYDPTSRLGSIPKEVHANSDGSFAIATVLPESHIITVDAAGKVAASKQYADLGVKLARFGRDGTLLADLEGYPAPELARFAADGTRDATFTTPMIEVPDVPADTVFLPDHMDALETSNAWVITAYVYMANAIPSSQLVLFRVWK